MADHLLLLPTPRHLSYSAGAYSLGDRQLIFLDGAIRQPDHSATARLEQTLQSRLGLTWETTIVAAAQAQVGLTVQVMPERVLHPQGYELEITPSGITIVAHDEAGVFYAVCTLVQILEQAGSRLPCLHISDWPDFTVRGVMLDVSRDKVPSMPTLLRLVDMLAGWKINQLQLYTEHTFAYPSHPDVWAKATPMTGPEIRELDAFCRQRHIELVPNQNSFGHLARWLRLPAYAPLAELTDGYEAPWGRQEGAFSLCPLDPGSLEFLHSLYDELLPHFSSRMLNVGCDETYDIGQGRSREACSRLGVGRVYLDFLLKIYHDLRRRGVTMQFWADMILHYPDLFPELPRDVVALEWGYEADHPFDEHAALLAQAGIPFYVCPGTSSWCSIAGRTDIALANLINAADSGLKHGAQGYLITDWGDNGHWQPLPVSYLGFVAGAAWAWALDANRNLDVSAAASLHAFRDPGGTMGKVAYDLGNVYRIFLTPWPNTSILFTILQRSLARIATYPGLTVEDLERMLESVAQTEQLLSKAAMQGSDADLILQEYQLVIRLMRHACRRGILALSQDAGNAGHTCQELARDLNEIRAMFRTVWLARNRFGGMEDSLARFKTAEADYC